MATTLTNTTTGAIQKFDLATIDRMTYYIRYNVEIFIQLYSYFVQNNLQAIVDYFENSNDNPDRQSFDFLESLTSESKKIKTLIRLNKNSFRQVDDWELLDFLEDVDTKLATIANTDRWTRSSKTQNSWQGNVVQTTYVLSDDQTLEQVSEQVYGANTSQDDWARIAVENNLSEFDYTTKGGNQIKITKRTLSNPNLFVNSIVDNLTDQKLYGLDFNRKIGFANNDLATLGYKETLVQSAEILVGIKKGDSPEFRSIGVDPRLAVGASFGSLKFASIIRQLSETFATDDSLRDFSVTNVSYQNGALTINYQVNTLYNFTYNNQTTIQQQ